MSIVCAVKLKVFPLHGNVTEQTEDKPQDDNLKRDILCQGNDYVSTNMQCVLRSRRWWYRQPADHSPWGAVEDAGSASTAAVNTLPLLPASHHAATLPQSGPPALLRPHGWVASRPSWQHLDHKVSQHSFHGLFLASFRTSECHISQHNQRRSCSKALKNQTRTETVPDGDA